MLTLTDRDLAVRSRRGDPEAFGELVRRYQTAVFNACYRLLGERREAEDLAQEAFIRAYHHLDSYDIERPFGPWMRRVAANLCINHLKAEHRLEVPLEDESDLAPIESGRLTPQAPSPETLHLQHEQAEALRRAILELPPAYRAVIELRHFLDLSYQEIAGQLGLPLSDVKSHLFRARKLLAGRLSASPSVHEERYGP
jgi:RNA polymerase sigma-70 factor, ECF subfamily